jgi:hypothetical protein
VFLVSKSLVFIGCVLRVRIKARHAPMAYIVLCVEDSAKISAS